MSKSTIEQAVHKERWFWFVHGHDLALMDAAKVCETIAAYSHTTEAERTSLQYAADVIRKKMKMDRDSPESKEVDAMLLAQCTCGGVAGGRSCTTKCGIFAGCIGDNSVVKAQVLVGQALSYIQGMGGTAPMTEENLHLLQKALVSKKPAMGDTLKECPFCESRNVVESVAERTVSRTFEMDTIEKKYNVVANTCSDCKEGWLDYRAEEAELQALVKMLHDEVHHQRGFAKAYLSELETLQAAGRVRTV